MKVNKVYTVRAYNAESQTLVHEYYTSLKEAKFRIAMFLDKGYEVIDDFKMQEAYTQYLSMVSHNPPAALLSYFWLVKEGCFSDARVLKKGVESE